MRSAVLRLTIVAVAVFGLGLVQAVYAAAIVSSGFDPSATLQAAVRYRNFANQGTQAQVYIGNGTLTASNAATFTGGWSQSSATNHVTFSYDGGMISTTVNNGSNRGPFNYSSGNLGSLNYVQIEVKSPGSPGTTVSFNNVKVNSENVGSFTAPALQQWNVKGISLTNSFTIEGDVILTGSQNPGDAGLIQVTVGHVAPSDTEGPVTSDVNVTPQPVLLNGPATVTANVSDTTTGNNTISSAEYSLNSGASTAMSASDGTFDEVTEEVTATIPVASQIGVNTVCVHGTDSLGNVGLTECQDFIVDYDFHGFLSPIDMGVGVVNKAKAGQAVPVKWRLTDYNGTPIVDPSSFVGLFSYQVDCANWAGDPLTAVQEVAAGQSALQYLGDGYWQFNWKTPKGYEGACHLMYVEFNSTRTSPLVQFSFEKK